MARLNSTHNQPVSAASWLTRLLPWAVAALLALSSPATAEKTAADYYVDSLPGQPEGPLLKMHAGYVMWSPFNEPLSAGLTLFLGISRLPRNITAISFSGTIRTDTLRTGRGL